MSVYATTVTKPQITEAVTKKITEAVVQGECKQGVEVFFSLKTLPDFHHKGRFLSKFKPCSDCFVLP